MTKAVAMAMALARLSLLLKRMGGPVGKIENVTDRFCDTLGGGGFARRFRRHLAATEQEEIDVVGGSGIVERRANRIAWPRRGDKPRRHDDHEVGFLLLIRGTAHQRADDGKVADPRELRLICGGDVLQQARYGEALPVTQFDR